MRVAVLVALGMALGFAPRLAQAICNVIPSANEHFRGPLGSLDRPFATPGELVQISLDAFGCDAGTPGFVDLPGGALPEDDYAVTVVFTPPSGRRNAVVVARDCAAFAQKVAACDAQLGAGTAACIPAGADGLDVVTATSLFFRFPDSAALVTPPCADCTLTGPASVAVTRSSDALPCGLGSAGQRCATSAGLLACIDDLFPNDGAACSAAGVDPLFGSFTALPQFNDFEAMTSAPGATPVRFTIDRAGNVLLPMDWQRVLVRVNGTPYPRLVSGFTTIAAFAGLAAGVRIPGTTALSAWAPNGVRVSPLFTPLADSNSLFASLFGTVDAPLGITRVARRLPVLNRCTTPANARGAACITQEQCAGLDRCLPVAVPEYQACAGGGNAGLSCLLGEDCPGGTCGQTSCRAGARAGAACATDAECPGSECGPQLFDFAGRLHPDAGLASSGVGPVVIGGGDYSVRSIGVTTLEGQRVTPRLLALVQPETLEDVDINGDGDALDPVVQVLDRTNAQLLALGYGFAQRAVTRVTRPPLRATAFEAEDDVVAFLEPEAFESLPFEDKNFDGDVLDHMLRVAGPNLAFNTLDFSQEPGDPTPVVNGRSLAVSDGLVFFRTAELDSAPRYTEIVDVDAGGYQGFFASGPVSLSGDGRSVAFASRSKLAPGGVDGEEHAYLRDRCIAGAIAIPGCTPTTELADVDVQGVTANAPSSDPRISRDGRFLLFWSTASNLDFVVPDTNGGPDLFVRDRCLADGVFLFGCTPRTTRVSFSAAGAQIAGLFGPSPVYTFSPSGRFLAFESAVNGIVPGDANGQSDLFLVDRDIDSDGIFDEPGTYAIERVNLDANGSPLALSTAVSGPDLRGTISDDGRFVAFSDAPAQRLLVRDRCRSFGELVPACVPTIELASVFPPGDPGAPVSGPWALSADGRRSAFGSGRTTPGNAYLRDLRAGGTTRFDVATADDSGTGPATTTSDVSLSGDGRFVSFLAGEPHLVPFDTNAELDAFVHDVLTGATERASVASSGAEAAGILPRATRPVISEDGLTVAFVSQATNLVPNGDANGPTADVFVRTYAGNSGIGDLTGDDLLRDHVLRVYDARIPFSSVLDLGPAREAAVAAGNAGFLRESDSMAMWWPNRLGGAPVALARKGDAVRATPTRIALLASEQRNDANYNGAAFSSDGDQTDWVVQVSPTAAPAAWINTGQASLPDLSFDATGEFVAFLGNEQTQGKTGTDFTADGDVFDLVPRLFDAATGSLVDLRDGSGRLQPARNLVLGAEALAFRVNEGDRCNAKAIVLTPSTCKAPLPSACPASACDLNGDGDCCDDILFGKDLGLGGPTRSSQRNVVDCALPACDPRTPYRVKGVTVRFLEPSASELLVRVWNLRTGAIDTLGTIDPNAPGAGGFAPFGDPLADDTGIVPGDAGAVIGGFGRCVAPRTPSSCSPATGAGCALGERCDTGTCVREYGTCRSLADCPPAGGIACVPDAAVLSIADSDGDSVFDPFDPAPRSPDPALAPCTTQPDLDGDGWSGACDNCPTAFNPDQKDRGGVGAGATPDGIGDECQCGDVSGDGRVTVTDTVLVTRALLNPPTATLLRPELCDTDAVKGCSIRDGAVARRALLLPPTATIARTCR